MQKSERPLPAPIILLDYSIGKNTKYNGISKFQFIPKCVFADFDALERNPLNMVTSLKLEQPLYRTKEPRVRELKNYSHLYLNHSPKI